MLNALSIMWCMKVKRELGIIGSLLIAPLGYPTKKAIHAAREDAGFFLSAIEYYQSKPRNRTVKKVK
jgi:hypothetical protein